MVSCLFGIEAEDREVAARPHRNPVCVERAERLTGVLHDPQSSLLGQRLEGRHVGRVAEDVHGQQPRRAVGHGGGGGRGVEIERAGVDVAEHRPGVLVQETVGRSHEAEGGGHNIVARFHPGGPDGQVKARGAARYRGHVPHPQPVGEGVLELTQPRAERQPA